jgi:hypothetical protein
MINLALTGWQNSSFKFNPKLGLFANSLDPEFGLDRKMGQKVLRLSDSGTDVRHIIVNQL